MSTQLATLVTYINERLVASSWEDSPAKDLKTHKAETAADFQELKRTCAASNTDRHMVVPFYTYTHLPKKDITPELFQRCIEYVFGLTKYSVNATYSPNLFYHDKHLYLTKVVEDAVFAYRTRLSFSYDMTTAVSANRFKQNVLDFITYIHMMDQPKGHAFEVSIEELAYDIIQKYPRVTIRGKLGSEHACMKTAHGKIHMPLIKLIIQFFQADYNRLFKNLEATPNILVDNENTLYFIHHYREEYAVTAYPFPVSDVYNALEMIETILPLLGATTAIESYVFDNTCSICRLKETYKKESKHFRSNSAYAVSMQQNDEYAEIKIHKADKLTDDKLPDDTLTTNRDLIYLTIAKFMLGSLSKINKTYRDGYTKYMNNESSVRFIKLLGDSQKGFKIILNVLDLYSDENTRRRKPESEEDD
jgi:hypothetical protein